MATRGLTKVTKNGEVKVAQYGQWDHHADGQGLNILKMLSEEGFVDRLSQAIDSVRYYTHQDMQALGGIYMEDYPALNRNTGSEILRFIADKEVKLLQDESRFEQDEYCEEIGHVDLDAQTFTWSDPRRNLTLTFPLNELPTPEVFVSLWEKLLEESNN